MGSSVSGVALLEPFADQAQEQGVGVILEKENPVSEAVFVAHQEVTQDVGLTAARVHAGQGAGKDLSGRRTALDEDCFYFFLSLLGWGDSDRSDKGGVGLFDEAGLKWDDDDSPACMLDGAARKVGAKAVDEFFVDQICLGLGFAGQSHLDRSRHNNPSSWDWPPCPEPMYSPG